MGSVTVLTAAKTKELTDAAVVSGTIEADGDLVLTKQDTTTVNLGNIIATVMVPGGIQMSHVLVLAPADSIPAGIPINTVILRTA